MSEPSDRASAVTDLSDAELSGAEHSGAGHPDGELTDREVDAFTRACNQVYALMHRNRSALAAARSGSGQLSDSQLAIVTPLTEHGAMSVGQLAERAGVAQPTVTRAIKQLAGAGIVTRERGPADDRTVLVALTPAGTLAWRAAVEQMRAFQRLALEHIAPARRATVVAALEELAQAIDQTS
jgi:MarR family transcriptional regulator, organic hydroperoxide resistance regulator